MRRLPFTALGPGLLESAYEACLAHELEKRGHLVLRQVALPLVYDTIKLEAGYRIDLIVDGRVIVEVKAMDVSRAGARGAAVDLFAPVRASTRIPHQLQRRLAEAGD